MSSQSVEGASSPHGAARANPLYFAVWRWHFYAGIFVVPFLLTLAVTGFFMMWFTTIAPEYGDRLTVAPAGEPLAPGALEAAALAAVPGATALSGFTTPRDATTPALLTVSAGEAGDFVVAVDPYSGAALRITPDGDTWNAFAETIHGTLMLGTLGDRLIEIAASLGLLLVVTGVYLWWPRGGGLGLRRLLVPDLAASGRGLWKSLHSVTGAWAALVLTFFFLSGLAWAGVWGEKFVQAWSTFPAEKWDNVPLSDTTHASMNHDGKEVPWALEQTAMPASGSEAGVAGLADGVAATLDTIVALGRQIGFDARFNVTPPQEDTGVWTLSRDSMSYDSTDPTSDRTVHIDRFTGKILADVRFADYSAAGKAMAVGVALHEGQTGLWNIILNGAFCAAVIFLCVSGAVMWWKRRPAGALRLAAPPRPAVVPLARGVVLIAIFMSMLFPMLGFALLAVLAVDLLATAAMPGLKAAVS